MNHRQTDLNFRGLGTPTKLRSDKPRCVAIGCANGGTFRIMQPAVFALVDEADFTRYMEFNAGYDAYNNMRGPGIGRNRLAGWMKARSESAAYVEAREEERRSQF